MAIRYLDFHLRYRHTDLWPDLFWLTPLALLLWLGLPALALLLLFRRRATPAVVIGVVAFLGIGDLLLLVPPLHKGAALVLALGLAVQAARILGPRSAAVDGLVRRTLPALAVALVVGNAAAVGYRWARERWALPHLPAAREGAPNVLLLVLDTVRSYNMSLYGYAHETTPRLEAWAAEGVRFDRAFAAAPWTLPSHASMFTGYWAPELRTGVMRPLDDAKPTLAEALTRAGYATGGFVANLSYGTWQFGLDRGFTHYEDFLPEPSSMLTGLALGRELLRLETTRKLMDYRMDIPHYKPAESINADFLEWLDGVEERPFFAFLNYFDAHAPYRVPPPFDTLFAPRNPRRPMLFYRDEPEFADFTAAEIAYEQTQYDGGIAYMDVQIDLLLRELRRRGLLDNTLVIITSDHGEQWGEHDRLSHTSGLYRQVLQVPLVIRYPKRFPAGAAVRTPVTLRDLAATIIDVTGVAARFPGHSLTEHVDATGERPVTPRPLFAYFHPPFQRQHALVAEGMHYILKASGDEMLFHLECDSLELRDLAATPEGAAVLPRMRTIIDSMIAESAANGALPYKQRPPRPLAGVAEGRPRAEPRVVPTGRSRPQP
ncbi:MAG TPA: sulfatase [Gemmatimonadaceae bacterium]|nr:sulfatase [Gemmatimonadaceae bacterium]